MNELTNNVLHQMVTYQDRPYFTSQYFHHQYKNVNGGGKYARLEDFNRLIRSIETYQDYIERRDIVELTYIKGGISNANIALLHKSTSYKPIMLISATAQVALTHHLDDKISKAASVKVNTQQEPMTQLEMMQVMIAKQIEQEKVNAQIPVLQNDIAEIKEQIDQNEHIFHRGDYTSIKAYCNVNKLNIDGRMSAAVGRACTKACGTQGIKVKKLPCPYFGEVNSYPVWVIEEVLLLMGFL